MRDVTEAHYLHERSGLDPVLRPPIRQPTALAWVPGKELLLVGTRAGTVQTLDPVMGCKVIAENVGEPACISVHSDKKHYLLVSRDGRYCVGEIAGGISFSGKHQFLAGFSCFWLKNHCILVGDEPDGRVLLVIKNGKQIMRARLPERVLPVISADGKGLMLARSTQSGLMVIPLGKGKFPKGTVSTSHRLIYTGSHILGITATGICSWMPDGGNFGQSMRLPDLTAASMTRDGRYLGLGTRGGAVALARLDKKEKRIRPDLVKAFDGPVTAVAFSTRARWLATCGTDHLQVWSWED